MKPQWYINTVLQLFSLSRNEKIAVLYISYTIYFLMGLCIVDFFSKPIHARFTYHKYPFLLGVCKNITKFPKGYFSKYAKKRIKGNTALVIPALISYPFATLYLDDISLLLPGLTILVFILLMTPTAFSMLGTYSLYRMFLDEDGFVLDLKTKKIEREEKDEGNKQE